MLFGTLNRDFGLGRHFRSIDNLRYGHAHSLCLALIGKNRIFASEGRRDFLNTAKCSQWPHLYTTYEATYGLKCLVFEKLAKN